MVLSVLFTILKGFLWKRALFCCIRRRDVFRRRKTTPLY